MIEPGRVRCVWPSAAALGEGACWSPRRQALYWVDILGQRLHRYSPARGEREQWDLPDTVSAVAERAGDRGLVLALRRGFAFFEPQSRRLQRLDEPEPERLGNRFNDGKCDALGRFWAGTMDFDCVAPTGALYRFDGPGRCERVFAAGFAVTNGPAWSADGGTMFFNDTLARRVLALPFDAQRGQVGAPRVLLEFGPEDGFPDGMTTDADGRLWIAHWGASCVSCHDALSGAELGRIELPTAHITSVAFGGAELATLFITSARQGLSEAQLAQQPLAGGLFAVEPGARGAVPHPFAS